VDREDLTILPANVEDVRVAIREKRSIRATPLPFDHTREVRAEHARILGNMGSGQRGTDLLIVRISGEIERLERRCGNGRDGLGHRKNLLREPIPDIETFATREVLTGIERLRAGGKRHTLTRSENAHRLHLGLTVNQQISTFFTAEDVPDRLNAIRRPVVLCYFRPPCPYRALRLES
jgi:hypothetical protein